MSTAARPRPDPAGRLDRRRALRLAGALTVAAGAAGCGVLSPSAEVPAAPADPLEPLIRRIQALGARYDATRAAHPAIVGPQLRAVRDAHRRHADALLGVLDARRRAHLTGRPVPPAAPAGEDAALAALRAGETALAAAARRACLATTDPHRAALLGSIAAADKTHLAVL